MAKGEVSVWLGVTAPAAVPISDLVDDTGLAFLPWWKIPGMGWLAALPQRAAGLCSGSLTERGAALLPSARLGSYHTAARGENARATCPVAGLYPDSIVCSQEGQRRVGVVRETWRTDTGAQRCKVDWVPGVAASQQGSRWLSIQAGQGQYWPSYSADARAMAR